MQTNPAVTNSAWFVCHDKPLNQQCIAHLGSPHDDAWIILLVVMFHIQTMAKLESHWTVTLLVLSTCHSDSK